MRAVAATSSRYSQYVGHHRNAKPANTVGTWKHLAVSEAGTMGTTIAPDDVGSVRGSMEQGARSLEIGRTV
jgi:hypothetical protein